jgi:hypothetical protein
MRKSERWPIRDDRGRSNSVTFCMKKLLSEAIVLLINQSLSLFSAWGDSA